MPAEFERCVKDGGRVRTIDVNKTQYMHVCFLNGKSYRGEVKDRKQKSLKPFLKDFNK